MHNFDTQNVTLKLDTSELNLICHALDHDACEYVRIAETAINHGLKSEAGQALYRAAQIKIFGMRFRKFIATAERAKGDK